MPPEPKHDMYELMLAIDRKVTEIAARCPGCNDRITTVEQILHGNGQPGIVKEVESLKTGRTDTLSVKSVVWLVASIAAALATAGGVGTMVGRSSVNGNLPAATSTDKP